MCNIASVALQAQEHSKFYIFPCFIFFLLAVFKCVRSIAVLLRTAENIENMGGLVLTHLPKAREEKA